MKLIVAGGRDFNDWDLLNRTLTKILERTQIKEVISGKAKGADTLGERFASENGIPVKEFPADWIKYGKRAGYLRNKQMANHGEALVAFWDGRSPGTKMMIDLAKELGLEVLVVRYMAG
jgi:hypothetical protein